MPSPLQILLRRIWPGRRRFAACLPVAEGSQPTEQPSVSAHQRRPRSSPKCFSFPGDVGRSGARNPAHPKHPKCSLYSEAYPLNLRGVPGGERGPGLRPPGILSSQGGRNARLLVTLSRLSAHVSRQRGNSLPPLNRQRGWPLIKTFLKERPGSTLECTLISRAGVSVKPAR